METRKVMPAGPEGLRHNVIARDPDMRIPLVLLVLTLAACGGKEVRRENAAPVAPVAVKTVAVSAAEWPVEYEATGTVRARTATQISARVMGYVRELHAEIGQRVKAGDLLVKLDVRDLESGVSRAHAAMAEVKSAIPEAEQAIAAARAHLDLAEVTHRRLKDLFDKKSASNQELDEAAARLQAARAAHQMAIAKQAQIRPREIEVDEARKAAEVMRGYGEIRAPFAGMVTVNRWNPARWRHPACRC